MMLLIDNIFVDEKILSTTFCCSLQKCLGACCVEGESGAPLNAQELSHLEEFYPQVKNYLPPENQKVIEKKGLYVKDSDGEWTTTLVKEKGPCVYAIFKNNTAFCAFEIAYYEKKIPWKKPLSCHLYPIRVEYKNGFVHLHYHQWNICKDALKNGNIPMFQFLKEAIIRNFGEEFYNQLDAIYREKYQK